MASALTPSGHLLKVPVVIRQEYTIALEQWRMIPFIHCHVHVPWTKDIKRNLQEDFRALMALHGGPFLALHDPEDKKHRKFLRLFGFKHIDNHGAREIWRVLKEDVI